MSDVWGTVYSLERDKATGNDPDSLRSEIALLKSALDCYSDEQARLRAALSAVRQELWVDYCLGMGRTDCDPTPFNSGPKIRIINDALGNQQSGERQ